MPPWNLEAHLRRRIFERVKDLKRSGMYDLQRDREVRQEESIMLMRQWSVSMEGPRSWGTRTTSAIRPHLTQWFERRFGELNYYSTQLMTGHGSFGHFLERIGKRESTRCYHCLHDDDTVEHTLAECPAWDRFRAELADELSLRVGEVLSLVLVVEKILLKEEHWVSFNRYAARVISGKEEEERRRERASLSPSP